MPNAARCLLLSFLALAAFETAWGQVAGGGTASPARFLETDASPASSLVSASIPASGTSGLPLVEMVSGEKRRSAFSLRDGRMILGNGESIPATAVRQILFGGEEEADHSRAVSQATDTAETLAIASAAAEFEARFPDAGGIVLHDHLRYVYRPNGTWSTFVRFLGKVKKEDHLGWADQAIPVTEGRERVRVIRARSISPAGEVCDLDPTQITSGKPQMSPGVFLKYLLSSFRVPGVEVGSLVEVEYELESFNPYQREFFFPINHFQGGDPVFLSRMTVEIPRDRKLFWEARNFPPGKESPTEAVVESKAGPVTRYVWERRELAPVVEEPLMPKGGDALPYVQASLFEGWDRIHDWINGYWKANTKPSAEVASRALEIAKGVASDEEKVARVLHWIEKNIRYIIIKGDAATIYGSYPAHETMTKQFGCCVDKAMVFSAMLNALGIENGPLLINAGAQEMSTRIPNLNITHAISRITRKDGSLYYLDSTGYDFRYPGFPTVDQGRLCIDPFRRSVDLIPMQKPEENMYKIVSSMSLSLDGSLTVESRKTYSGEAEANARGFMKDMKPTEREQFLGNRINGYGQGARLASFTLSDLESLEIPYEYRFSYAIPEFPREVADLVIFKLPGLMESIAFPEAGLPTRNYPIEYESTSLTCEEYELKLEDGLSIRSLPEPLEINNGYFRFEQRYEKLDESRLRCRITLAHLAKRVPREVYTLFKADVDKVERCRNQRIFLTRRVSRRAEPSLLPQSLPVAGGDGVTPKEGR